MNRLLETDRAVKLSSLDLYTLGRLPRSSAIIRVCCCCCCCVSFSISLGRFGAVCFRFRLRRSVRFYRATGSGICFLQLLSPFFNYFYFRFSSSSVSFVSAAAQQTILESTVADDLIVATCAEKQMVLSAILSLPNPLGVPTIYTSTPICVCFTFEPISLSLPFLNQGPSGTQEPSTPLKLLYKPS